MLAIISDALNYIGGLLQPDPGTSDDFLGFWDANANDPTIADGSAEDDQYYIVSVAGTQDLGSGPIVFSIDDVVQQIAGVWVNQGPAPAVQTDWDENNASSPAFLVNRPTFLTNGSNADSGHRHALIRNTAGDVVVQALVSVISLFTNGLERLRVLTNGDIQLFQYPNTRNDGTQLDIPVYYPAADGTMQVGKVLPYSSTSTKTTGNVNQSTTFLTYHTHNVTVPEDGVYNLKGKYRWSINSTGQDFQLRVVVDGTPLPTSDHQQESTDSGGGGILLEDLANPGSFPDTGTNQRITAPIFESLPLLAGAHTIEYQITATAANIEPAVYDLVDELTRSS